MRKFPDGAVGSDAQCQGDGASNTMTILAIDPGPAEVSFFVPGLPRPGGSKRAFINRKTGRAIVTEDCKGSKDWRTAVAFAAAERIRAWLPGPLRVTFSFYLPRPRGHYGAGARAFYLRASAPDYPAVRPDLTKLIRSTEDALKGIGWRDDSQIVHQMATKQYADDGKPVGAQITIAPANEEPDAESSEGQVPPPPDRWGRDRDLTDEERDIVRQEYEAGNEQLRQAWGLPGKAEVKAP